MLSRGLADTGATEACVGKEKRRVSTIAMVAVTIAIIVAVAIAIAIAIIVAIATITVTEIDNALDN